MIEIWRGVVYEPKILRSLAEICDTFGVSKDRVRYWVQLGAPIIVEGEGSSMRYSAELMRLQTWREMQQGSEQK